MPAHDSQYPGEVTSKSFRVDSTGVSLNWRNSTYFAAVMLSLLAGTGGYASVRLVTAEQVDEKVEASEARQDRKIDVVKQSVKESQEAIVGLTATVGDVQLVQHSDIAHREARRVVDEQMQCRREDAICQDRRDSERERIRRLNVKRLQAKLDPCVSLLCE